MRILLALLLAVCFLQSDDFLETWFGENYDSTELIMCRFAAYDTFCGWSWQPVDSFYWYVEPHVKYVLWFEKTIERKYKRTFDVPWKYVGDDTIYTFKWRRVE